MNIDLPMSDDARRRHLSDGADIELGTEGRGGSRRQGGRWWGLGAVLAALAAAGTLALPGIGLIAMGPIAAALTGGAIGAAGGGLLGALVGYGIPEEQARRYESGLRDKHIVMGVRPHSEEDARVNLKTAKALGLTIPQSVLLRADEVIQ